MQKEPLSPKALVEQWQRKYGDQLPSTVEGFLNNPDITAALIADLRQEGLLDDNLQATLLREIDEGQFDE